MFVHQLADEVLAGDIKARERLVEQPDRRRLPQHQGEGGALFLAGGEIAHRHFGERLKPEPRHDRRAGSSAVQTEPEGERAALRQFGIEHGAFVEQSERANPLHKARIRRAQACKSADQRRLARAIRACHMARRARFQPEREPPEQQPLAAPAGQVMCGQGRG